MFETLNFANDNFTVLAGPGEKTYKDTCEYRQLLGSSPDIIVSMIGAKESLNKQTFNADAFIQGYSSFIKEMQSLPSGPLFILVTPIYSSQSLADGDWKPFKLNELDGPNFLTLDRSWQNAKTDISILVAKVAEANGIPFQNVVDSESVVKVDSLAETAMADAIHPNERGYGRLAQEIYMRLAFSEQLKTRVQ